VDEGVPPVEICLGKAPVDVDGAAVVGGDFFALEDVHRRMAVDDPPGAELAHDHVHELPSLEVLGPIEQPLLVRGLVLQEIALEGLHRVLAEEGRLGAAPQIKHEREVFRVLRFVLKVVSTNGLDHVLYMVQELLAAFTEELLEFAVLGAGDEGVDVEDEVIDVIQLALLEEELHQRLHLDAPGELERQVVDHRALLVGELGGVGQVQRREVRVREPLGVAGGQHAGELFQPQARFHLELGILANGLLLELELDHRERLFQLAREGLFRLEGAGHVVGVDPFRKGDQAADVDVQSLQEVQIVVAGADPQRLGDQRLVPRRRPHPQDVVVAPDEGDIVYDVLLGQDPQDLIGLVAPVEDVPEDHEVPEDHLLHDLAQRADDALGDEIVFVHDIWHGHVENEVLEKRPQVVVDGVPDLVEVDAVLDLVLCDLHQCGYHVLALHRVRFRGEIPLLADEPAQVVDLVVGEGLGERLATGLPHEPESPLED